MANLQHVIPMETRRDKRESTPDIDFDYDYDDTEDSPNLKEKFPKLDSDLLFELDLPSPPQKIVLSLNVYFDKNWLPLFGQKFGQKLLPKGFWTRLLSSWHMTPWTLK